MSNDFEGSNGGPVPKMFATFKMPKPMWWQPMPDITPYELARATPVLILMSLRPMNFNSEDVVSALPPEVARHFTDQQPV